jgi:hypothetical protein
MLDHLLVDDEDPWETASLAPAKPEFVTAEHNLKKFQPADNPKTTPTEVVGGKLRTLDLFASLGVVNDEALKNATNEEKHRAREAFSAVVDPRANPKEAKKAALALRTPVSTAYASTMLQAYDWDYVAQAANIRAFVVTKLIDEAERNPDAKYRLRSLELLGKVSGVDLFENRVQVSITHTPQAEIEKRLGEKLKMLQAIDVETKEVFDEHGVKVGKEVFAKD